MYNALKLPQISKLVQVGIRDYCEEEFEYISNSNFRIVTYFDKDIKERQYEGQQWKQLVDEIVNHLPEKVFISFAHLNQQHGKKYQSIRVFNFNIVFCALCIGIDNYYHT